jgi:ribosomal protein S18
MAAKPFFRRRKSDPFDGEDAPKIDYKDVRLLQRYISERGKIVPARITAVSAKKPAQAGTGHQARSFPRAVALCSEVRRNRYGCDPS